LANIDVFAIHRSDLNTFLFAEVGAEAGGMSLTVLSTLARSDKDPWEEAGRLAKLPRLAAARELAKIIAAMPGSLWPPAESAAIARRLVALLPARGSGAAVSRFARAAEAETPGRVQVARPSYDPLPAAPAGRRSVVVIAMLAALLAGLTLDLAGQRTPDHGAAKPGVTSTSSVTPAGYAQIGEAAGQ
jgi:hypothetical protein